MKEWKEGDVFSWSYNETDVHSSTQYWCCSQTGVVASNEIMYDTFWGIGINENGRLFTSEDIGSKIEISFIANLNDYETCRKEDRCYYDDKDFLDLSNSNNGNRYFYLRKGAVKSLDKMRKILERNVKDAEYKLKSAQQNLEWEKSKLEELTLDSYVYAREGVSMEDVSYLDEVDKGGN